jgi:uncharacterized protein
MGEHGPPGISVRREAPLVRGARPEELDPGQYRGAYKEVILLWLGVMVLIRIIVDLQSSLGLPEVLLGAVPLLFIYAPVWLCSWRGVDSWSYNLSIPAFRDLSAWWAAIRLNGLLNLWMWPFFIPIYHFWNSQIWNKGYLGLWPNGVDAAASITLDGLALTIAHQVLYVAIPEEFFYRGYLQTRLNELHPRKFLIFGVPIGWGALIASLLFAFGHSLVQFQWWHFAIFFPSLIFSWMREKTGGVVAGALFHASCNVGVVCLDTLYGIRGPMITGKLLQWLSF